MLLKTTLNKKLEKVTKFFSISKNINPKKNSLQPIGYPAARKTRGKS